MLPAVVKAATVSCPNHTALTVLSLALTPGHCHKIAPSLQCTTRWMMEGNQLRHFESIKENRTAYLFTAYSPPLWVFNSIVPWLPQLQSDRLPWQELWESRVYPSDDLVGPLIPDDTSMEDSAELAAGQNASRPSDASSIRLAVPNGEHDHVSASSRLCSFWVTGNNLLQSKGAYGA